MKTRIIAAFLLVAFLLGGCSSNEEEFQGMAEVLPGIYLSNGVTDFPFPTSGYTVYIVGEIHGNQETKLIFQSYLQSLYKDAGLRDIILEEDQAYEMDATGYVHGLTGTLPDGLCLRADILGQIREFNAKLPDDEKVNVHLVEVDSPMPIVYEHLVELHQQLGSAATSIEIPSLSDFNTWGPRQRYALTEELQKIAVDQPNILNGLDTVYLSLRWYSLGNRMDTAGSSGLRSTFAPIREDVSTKNIEHVLKVLDGKPVLAFYGSAHGMKAQAAHNPPVEGFKPWAQRLVESGVDVYSVAIDGLTGAGYWRGESFPYGVVTDEYKFDDGTSIVSLFDDHPDINIIYTDLRTEDNQNIQLPSSEYLPIPASQVYDGLILFKEFTTMENVCTAQN